ncbi:hypothetical protein [Rhizobium sp. N324]|uniref:hypothetical protein n=1 Tax=Rhizobium sp. N324 TaxID=1703969 RepID=UPI0007F0FF92|nr:hypothetical protein [Rhizobium sp. N324]ANM12104.1 hypothetical protein AMK05_CH03755 [Rhizobium sp. N324]
MNRTDTKDNQVVVALSDTAVELYQKLAASPLGMAQEWRVEGERGKPLLYGRSSLIAYGTIGTWDEFRLIAALVNALAGIVPEAHPDDLAVDRFAGFMKRKLARKREQGRGGWEDKAQCSNEHLSQLLRDHVEKGDALDVANLAMMIHQRDERIARVYPEAPRRALRTALDHIEHMANWIKQQNAGYSFESLGEDMQGMVDALGTPSPGGDDDHMIQIEELISQLEAIHDRFGNTCVYIRRGGMGWGAVALNRRDDDRKNGVFELQAQHDRDMHARLEQIGRMKKDRDECWHARREAEGSRDAARAAADSMRIERDAMRKVVEELKFALFSSDMTIKDRADQSARLVLDALATAAEVSHGD